MAAVSVTFATIAGCAWYQVGVPSVANATGSVTLYSTAAGGRSTVLRDDTVPGFGSAVAIAVPYLAIGTTAQRVRSFACVCAACLLAVPCVSARVYATQLSVSDLVMADFRLSVWCRYSCTRVRAASQRPCVPQRQW